MFQSADCYLCFLFQCFCRYLEVLFKAYQIDYSFQVYGNLICEKSQNNNFMANWHAISCLHHCYNPKS